MILKSKIIGLTILVATTLSMAGCTVPTTEAGNTQTYYEGKITGIELIDMKTNRNDNTKNTLLGAVGGALLGNLIGKNSTGTVISAGAGALAGNALSEYGQRHDGVRLSVDTDNGPVIVDMPFSCKYAIGKKVRLISGSSQGSVMVYNKGHYYTATEDSKDKCPTKYYKLKANGYDGE